jgi:hypothetical protein
MDICDARSSRAATTATRPKSTPKRTFLFMVTALALLGIEKGGGERHSTVRGAGQGWGAYEAPWVGSQWLKQPRVLGFRRLAGEVLREAGRQGHNPLCTPNIDGTV